MKFKPNGDRLGVITLPNMIKTAHSTAVEHGWWDTPRSDGELIALMHSELSEALEASRNDEGDMRVGEELADCVIRIMDYCGERKIDLEKCILDKMTINQKRPYRHGGKKW